MGPSQSKIRGNKQKKSDALADPLPQVYVVPPENGTAQGNELKSGQTTPRGDRSAASSRRRDASEVSQQIEDSPRLWKGISFTSAQSSPSWSRMSSIRSMLSLDGAEGKQNKSSKGTLPSASYYFQDSVAEGCPESSDRLAPSAPAERRRSSRQGGGKRKRSSKARNSKQIFGDDQPNQSDASAATDSGADSPKEKSDAADGTANAPEEKDICRAWDDDLCSDDASQNNASGDNHSGADGAGQKDTSRNDNDDMEHSGGSRKKSKKGDESGGDDSGADVSGHQGAASEDMERPHRSKKKKKRKQADDADADEERKKKKKRKHKSSRNDDKNGESIQPAKKKKRKKGGASPSSPSKKLSRREDSEEPPREDPTLTAPAEWKIPAKPMGDANYFLTFSDTASCSKHPFAHIAQSHNFEPRNFLAVLDGADGDTPYLNIRWPRAVLHAIYNFQAAIVQNEIPVSTWLDTPLKDFKQFYSIVNAEGRKESRTLGALFAIMVRAITSNKDAKLETLDQKTLTWFMCLTGKKLENRAARLQLLQSWTAAQETIISKEDRRPLSARSFSDVMDIIFAACQGIHVIQLGKCWGGTDATIMHYGKVEPLMPPVTFVDMELTSTTQFASDCKVRVIFGGSARGLGPWGMKIQCADFPDDINLTSELIDAGRDNVLDMGWETWSKLPVDKFITLTIVPESGSAFTEKVSRKVRKPLSEHIDFSNKVKFPANEVVFAATFGDKSGMHYVFRTPLAIYAEKGHVLAIKNVTEDKKWVIPAESVKDLDRWLFENTKDMGNGWGNLLYLGKGDIKDGKLVNTVMWDEKSCVFAVEQIPRQKKVVTPGEESTVKEKGSDAQSESGSTSSEE